MTSQKFGSEFHTDNFAHLYYINRVIVKHFGRIDAPLFNAFCNKFLKGFQLWAPAVLAHLVVRGQPHVAATLHICCAHVGQRGSAADLKMGKERATNKFVFSEI